MSEGGRGRVDDGARMRSLAVMINCPSILSSKDSGESTTGTPSSF